jgi:hypothetical protein
MAQLTTEAELRACLGHRELPRDLDELGSLERAMVLLAMQESTAGEYPTELFDSLRTVDDCLYYIDVKRGQG